MWILLACVMCFANTNVNCMMTRLSSDVKKIDRRLSNIENHQKQEPAVDDNNVLIQVPTAFLIPENTDSSDSFSEEICNIIADTFSAFLSSDDSLEENINILNEAICEELDIQNWQHPDDIPMWTYPLIGEICHTKGIYQYILNTDLGEKILELWPLDNSQSSYCAKCERIRFIGYLLLEKYNGRL